MMRWLDCGPWSKTASHDGGAYGRRHFEIRLAHVHGSLFALINIAAGYLLIKFPVSAGHASAISWLALAGLLMPIGIVAHALFGVPPVLVLGGGAAMIVATLWMSWVAFSGALTAA
jgi:hypothetical protein